MPRRERQIRGLALGGMSAALLASGALLAVAAAPPGADEPDLIPLLPTGQSNPNDRWVDTRELPGRTLYRFDTVILNVGSGAFEVYRAPDGSTRQRVWEGGDPGGTGTPKAFPAGAHGHQDLEIAGGASGGTNAMRFSAAYGHNHFHSQRVAAYALLGADGTPVREASKNLAGFCLYDSWGPPASQTPSRYPGDYGGGVRPCAYGEPHYRGLLRMGIQRGWGDFYGSQLYDQWVDVTGVTPGTYALRATVDPDHLYAESDEGDNTVTDPEVVIPGVIAGPRAVTTAAGTPVAIPLAGSVIGADVKSRRTTCAEDQTSLASCTETADPAAVTFDVPPARASEGTLALSGSTATFTPAAGFSGRASFTYTAADSRGLRSAPATVTVTVAAAAGGSAGSTGSAGSAGSAGSGGSGSTTPHFTLSARQLLINQRIGQAAIRRLNAVEATLDGRPAPAAGHHAGGRVSLSAAQLLINQRIYQAGVRRAAALEARLAHQPVAAAHASHTGGTVRLSLGQLVINQRIAQAAVRRANALKARVG